MPSRSVRGGSGFPDPVNGDYLPSMSKSAFPTKAAKVPNRAEWIHEIKHDGYRLIVQHDGERVRLFTRNGHDWSGRTR